METVLVIQDFDKTLLVDVCRHGLGRSPTCFSRQQPRVSPDFDSKKTMSSDLVLSSLSPDGILTLTLNRPKQLNSVNDYSYTELITALNFASKETKVKVVVLTGSEFRAFCAGADLAAGFDPFVGPLKSGRGSYHDPVGRFMSTVIAFDKPLIAAVNGLAIGVGTTLLPHCDFVYAAEHARFQTPFTKIGVCPEFCSSVLFPEIMGPHVASQVLYLGRSLSAQQAKDVRLVGQVVAAKTRDEFLESVYAELRPALEFKNSGKSMRYFRQLIRSPQKIAELEMVHRKEMSVLDERSAGPQSDAAQGVAAMQQGKKSNM